MTFLDHGGALDKEQNFDGAVTAYRKALSLQPDDAGAHYKLGEILEKKGNRAAALEEFCAALKLNPDDPDFQAACKRLSDELKQYEN